MIRHFIYFKDYKYFLVSPNVVRLDSRPMDGVAQGKLLKLYCSTNSANPPPSITWTQIDRRFSSNSFVISEQVETKKVGIFSLSPKPSECLNKIHLFFGVKLVKI